MRARWKDFELPTRVVLDPSDSKADFGRFLVEPFERGYGTTIGNSLRRVLLASIEGAAPTSVKLKGVSHEFSTIEGVVEDVTDIILNVKKLVLRMHSEEPKRLRINVQEKGEVKAAHIIPEPAVEVVNPDLHLCTLADDIEFALELEVRKGRGYVTAQENQPEEQEIGMIPVDSLFSPVRRVKYAVESTRVGKLTNYDRLLLEIWTNGTITPELALVEGAKILRKHLNVFVHYFELGRELQVSAKREEELRKREAYRDEFDQKLSMPVTELDLSVRAANCLQSEKIFTVRDLVMNQESDLLRVRNFGKTSLKEVKRKLAELGLALGMELAVLQKERAPES